MQIVVSFLFLVNIYEDTTIFFYSIIELIFGCGQRPRQDHYWSNRSYYGYDDLRQAAVEAWQKSALNPEIIKSVCRAKYVDRIV